MVLLKAMLISEMVECLGTGFPNQPEVGFFGVPKAKGSLRIP